MLNHKIRFRTRIPAKVLQLAGLPVFDPQKWVSYSTTQKSAMKRTILEYAKSGFEWDNVDWWVIEEILMQESGRLMFHFYLGNDEYTKWLLAFEGKERSYQFVCCVLRGVFRSHPERLERYKENEATKDGGEKIKVATDSVVMEPAKPAKKASVGGGSAAETKSIDPFAELAKSVGGVG